ncbi:extracellular solute-binding protein [Chitinimonas sp. BJYL2]|uniref:extracellular solute-binding protein n=1 Tax=Chitinimonas sp. BJYL2 TaxID=2976696 RepID=UPI0022B48990|nr:extracellular solute-binding protein [Chitinimonas sp. BJYL2]
MNLRRLARLAVLALPLLCAAAVALPVAAKPRLEFWTQSLSPKFAPYFRELVASYNAANPQVEVVWVDYPWDVIRAKFTVALASGNPPALANVDVPTAYEFRQIGLIQPVDRWIRRDDFVAAAIADVTFGNQVYAWPFYNGANVVAYNTELFRRAGLDPKRPPASFAEQLRYAKILYARTGAAGFPPALGPGKIEGLMIAEGLEVIRGGKAVFNSPAHVEFVRLLADAYKAGGLLRDNLFGQDNFQLATAAYNSGRLAMLVTSPAALNRIRDDAPSVYKITEVTAEPLGRSGIAKGGWLFTFVVPKNVKPALLPEVGKFANFLTNAANQLAFAQQAGTLPTSRAAAAHAHFHLAPKDADPARRGLIAAANNIEVTRTVFLADVRNAALLSAKLSAVVEQAVTGRRDAKEALDDAVAFWNEKLGQ